MINRSKDFLRRRVEEDLKLGRYKKIVTRFPPEPNGFPHIGHAKSISINFGIAKEYGGECNLRMDDTNPTTENIEFVEALKDAVEWLGFKWSGDVRYTSDYFLKLYNYAIKLIKMGKAYVDSLSEEEIRKYRGTVTTAGKRSIYAERSIDENLELFVKMKNGEFREGDHVLRAKVDMSSPNMKMRDPLLYRIKRADHFRAKDKWAIYPMYDFAHPLSDYIEGVTHSICTLEFENNRDIYDWLIDTLELEPPRPYQHEFARLNINHTVMSKRKILELIDKNIVSSWDDPRLPTIAGLRRRGYTPEAILNFCEQIGVAKANSIVDIAQLEFAIRDDLNPKVPRVMSLFRPLKVTIENYIGFEEIEASYYPHDVPKEGSRVLPFSKEIYIEQDDFMENPPKGYYRLTPNQPVRLKYAYIISCQEVIKDDSGNIVEIKAKYYPNSKSGSDSSGIRVKSAIQWVEANSAKKIEVRLYDRLFKKETPESIEDINPNSLEVIKNALIEPAVIQDRTNNRFQFERHGYFYRDSNDKPIFNRIVSLKDSWAKKIKKDNRRDRPKPKREQIDGKVVPMSQEEKILFNRYIKEYKLNREVANTLARDRELSKFYQEALKESNSSIAIGNITTNEVARELKVKKIDEVKFTPKYIADLAKMIENETISTKIAKQVFEEMSRSGKEPTKIVEDRGLKQINDKSLILSIIKEVISKNSDNVKKFKDGNRKLLGFFIGEVLKASKGKANPKIVNELVVKELT